MSRTRKNSPTPASIGVTCWVLGIGLMRPRLAVGHRASLSGLAPKKGIPLGTLVAQKSGRFPLANVELRPQSAFCLSLCLQWNHQSR